MNELLEVNWSSVDPQINSCCSWDYAPAVQNVESEGEDEEKCVTESEDELGDTFDVGVHSPRILPGFCFT